MHDWKGAFREYDVRGIYGREITEELARRLGRAYAAMLGASPLPVVVGRDVRPSGEALAEALIEGLTESGLDVADIGVVPTPLAYFGVFTLPAAGCVMVTASHNPSEYNGFKMMMGRESLHGEAIRRLAALVEEGAAPAAARRGDVRAVDLVPRYRDFVVRDCAFGEGARRLKVVIDAGNGPAGVVAAPIYRALGCEVVELHCEPDGTFPNHHPDPVVDANLADLIARVREEKADLGIAFDGDGDRIGVVDEQGDIVRGDMLLVILGRTLLAEHPGATIISEVKCSERMYADLRARGGRVIMWKTGHSPIKAKMKETGALLAGEMSGHVFFADRYFGFDDAIYAGARLLQVLARDGRPLSALAADLPPAVATPEIRVECPDAEKFAVVEEAKRHFAQSGGEVTDIDGVRVRFADGAWGLLRASNTQPALVLRFEAPDEARLAEVRRLFEDWLAARLPD